MPRVVIVGAGLSGLSLAYRLRQAVPGVSVTVLEKAARPGGNVWTEQRDGFRFETGPNGFLDAKPSTLALCRDLGIAARLLPASEGSRKNRYLFLRGKLQRLPGSLWQFVTSPLMSWRGKVNFALELLRRPPKRPPADESVAAFAKRRAGKEAAEVFADALVTGIHAGDPALLSVKAAFPRVARLEAEYGSVIRGFDREAGKRRRDAAARGEPPPGPSRLWSFREGLRLLIETLSERAGAAVITGVGVRAVERDPARPGWVVRGDGTDRWPADAVVLTAHAPEQSAMLADLDPELAALVASIPYVPVAVVALGYRAADVPGSLDGFGYIAPQRGRRDLLGVQWCSSIFPDRAPPGMVLWRALCGGWHRRDVAGWPEEQLVAAVRHELRLAMRVRAAPVFHEIVRWPRAIPQYTLGHLERVARIEQRGAALPGLFLGGNAYHGVAMNDCTEQAEVLAGRVKAYLRGGTA